MNKNAEFVETAKARLDELGKEFSALDAKLNDAGRTADTWTNAQASKLKKDWEQAKADVSSIAQRIETEGEEAVGDAREKAERHWEALRAAVKTYREHLEKDVAV